MINIPFAARFTAPTTHRAQAVAGPRFTATMLVLMAWFLGGLCIDGWAHNHGKVDQSFFTPWHAVFYSGFAAVVGGLAGMITVNRSQGYAWHQAVPAGYERGLTGAIIFAFGGMFDLVWHTLFGIERGVEALLSPSHLLLALGMILVMSSPLRASWRATTPSTRSSLRSQLPLVLSITFTLTVLTFITAYLHPFLDRWPASLQGGEGVVLGMGGILLQTMILMGFVLMAVRHWRLAPGSLTLVFTLNAALMSVLEDTYPMILVALIAGAGADMLVALLRPSATRPTAFRWFAAVVPVILYTCYFLLLEWTEGLVWSTHLLTGAPVLAAAVSLGLSYLVLPPERTQAYED